MCLIILVPFESSMYSVEESRFPRSELVLPAVRSRVVQALLEVEEFLVFVQMPRRFVFIKSLRGKISQRGRRNVFDKVCGTLTSRQEIRRADEVTSSKL